MLLNNTQHAVLAKRKKMGLYRSRFAIEKNHYLSFSSNDYLGLKNNAQVKRAFKKAIDQYGTGSGASYLLSGYSKPHAELEEALAEFLGFSKVMLFSSGYAANLGVMTALMTQKEAIFQDRYNHASLLDGGLFSGARLYRYRHVDCEHLKTLLKQSMATEKLIVTEGVFSMEGGVAPLRELNKIAQENQAALMIDDAHGLGILGHEGRGTASYFGLNSDSVLLTMGTFGKALGCFGAFVAANEAVIDWLVQFARPYIYTTGLPEALAIAVQTSLKIMRVENWRREKLTVLIRRFRKAAREESLTILPSRTPIQCLLVGNPHLALAIGEKLKEKKILVAVVRFPTVPKGTDRLRISLNALHTEQDMDYLIEALAWAVRSIQKN